MAASSAKTSSSNRTFARYPTTTAGAVRSGRRDLQVRSGQVKDPIVVRHQHESEPGLHCSAAALVGGPRDLPAGLLEAVPGDSERIIESQPSDPSLDLCRDGHGPTLLDESAHRQSPSCRVFPDKLGCELRCLVIPVMGKTFPGRDRVADGLGDLGGIERLIP